MYIHTYIHAYIHIYIYIYIYIYSLERGAWPCVRACDVIWAGEWAGWQAGGRAGGQAWTPTANLRTKILDFRGIDSSIILVLRGGIPRPMGNFPEIKSQPILVWIILVGRLSVAQGGAVSTHFGLVLFMYRYEYVSLSLYIYVYMYICIYTCMCTYIHIHRYVYIYIYIYTYTDYIYIHTYTHYR